MTACPNSYEAGCRCPEHAHGPLTSTTEPVLRVIRTTATHVCHGYSHGCVCTTCKDRADNNGQPTDATPTAIRQPWEPRPARRAA